MLLAITVHTAARAYVTGLNTNLLPLVDQQ